jgi:hypothetical protein
LLTEFGRFLIAEASAENQERDEQDERVIMDDINDTSQLLVGRGAQHVMLRQAILKAAWQHVDVHVQPLEVAEVDYATAMFNDIEPADDCLWIPREVKSRMRVPP